MSDIYIDEFIPNFDNAKEIIALKRKDLIRAGLDYNRAGAIYDPNNSKQVYGQLEKLNKYNKTRRILGAFACRETQGIIGLMESCNWEESETGVLFDNIRGRMKLGTLALCHGRPFVIESLIADENFMINSIIVDKFLNDATKRSSGKDIYLTIDKNFDTGALKTMTEHGFSDAGIDGTLHGISKELYRNDSLVRLRNRSGVRQYGYLDLSESSNSHTFAH